MSDWDFLYEMHDLGCSPNEIMDAASSGAAPWEWAYIAKQDIKSKWAHLKNLRDSGQISRKEFKERKLQLFS